jgi:acyl-coenzyme A synthetase/AMP-(fatty) acid ligase
MAIPGRPPPTTFEAIELAALREPARAAMLDGTLGWSYGHVYLHLVRFSRALSQLGVRRGQRVAVAHAHPCVEMLLLIACENLGAVTASFLAENDNDAPWLFSLVDWVLADLPQACPEGVRFQLLDEAFLERVAAIDPHDGVPCPRVSLELHEAQRLTRTSGSTGRSRFMLLSRWTQDQWLRRGAEKDGYDRHTRLLVAAPMVMNAAYTRACSCLRMGAQALFLSPEQFQELGATHLLALPLRLEEFLARLPEGAAGRHKVSVATVGGAVRPAVRERAGRFFGVPILNRYGTNETGGICADLDASGTGLLDAGVDVRIVDEEGNELPAGEIGAIAVRTPVMTDGYLGDPEATSRAFRGGWFHSGDWGALVGPRTLRLAGRYDDLLNIGGIKVPAAKVEEDVRQFAQVLDCAMLAVNLPPEGATVGIALVVQPHTRHEEFARQLGEALGLGSATAARIVFVDALPRRPGGKLDRAALHRLLARSAG